jgi:hypothetical protein
MSDARAADGPAQDQAHRNLRTGIVLLLVFAALFAFSVVYVAFLYQRPY